MLYLGSSIHSFDVVTSSNVRAWNGDRHSELMSLAGGPKAQPHTFAAAVAAAQSLQTLSQIQCAAQIAKLLGVSPPSQQQIDTCAAATADAAAAAAAATAAAAVAAACVSNPALDMIANAVSSDGTGMTDKMTDSTTEQPADVIAATTVTESPVHGKRLRASAREVRVPLQTTTVKSLNSAAAPIIPSSGKRGSAASIPSTTHAVVDDGVTAAVAALDTFSIAPGGRRSGKPAKPPVIELDDSDGEPIVSPLKRARGVNASTAPTIAQPASAAAPVVVGAKRGRAKPASAVIDLCDEPDVPAAASQPAGTTTRSGRRVTKKR